MRTLTAGAIAALQAGAADGPLPIVLLVEMAFSPALRLATSAVDIEWGGHTWLRTGSLGTVEPVQDSSGDAAGLRFALSSVPSENLALVLGQSVRNVAITLRMVILNPATHAIEDVSVLGTFVGEQMTVQEGPAGATIAVTALPRARLFARPKPMRYTDGDQQRLQPGDRCLEYIVSQSTHQDVWPAASWGRQ